MQLKKQMGRIVRNHVSVDPNLTFHSLRHSFRDELRDRGFPREIEARLGGWKTSDGSAMDGYGRGHKLMTLREWIAKVDYNGIHVE